MEDRRCKLGLAGLVGFCRRTIYKVLARDGVSQRRPETRRQTFRRFEWSHGSATAATVTATAARGGLDDRARLRAA